MCEKLSFSKNDLVPSTRWGHTANVYQDKMYVLGGRNEVDICDLFIFDPKTMKWTE